MFVSFRDLWCFFFIPKRSFVCYKKTFDWQKVAFRFLLLINYIEKAMYVVLEGGDSVFKTTQIDLLSKHCRETDIPHIITAEPGNRHCEVTQSLRGLALDNKWKHDMTPLAREMIFQSARSINLEKMVLPALKQNKLVIQDRGLLSGIVYGCAQGFDANVSRELQLLTTQTFCAEANRLPWKLYDLVIILEGDTEQSTKRLSAKKEFADGDAMESKGQVFMQKVHDLFHTFNTGERPHVQLNCPIERVNVLGKSKEAIHEEILAILTKHGLLKDGAKRRKIESVTVAHKEICARLGQEDVCATMGSKECKIERVIYQISATPGPQDIDHVGTGYSQGAIVSETFTNYEAARCRQEMLVEQKYQFIELSEQMDISHKEVKPEYTATVGNTLYTTLYYFNSACNGERCSVCRQSCVGECRVCKSNGVL